jgi:hypothetical protein
MKIVQDKQRDSIIDFLRGLIILDMIFVHYSVYFPKTISKVINYHDVAMEGFLLLSGLMIGRHYLPQFLTDRIKVTKKLINRALKLVAIQYILIITISYPHYLIINGGAEANTSVNFLLESFLFYNQIGLMHILPTFIPLFIVSPLILFQLSTKYDWLVLFISLVLFYIGQANPYVFSYGDKTIFPVILWQIYFIIGCYLGKMSYEKYQIIPENTKMWLLISFIFISVSLCFKHSSTISKLLTEFKIYYSIEISKFPLNLYGLFFGLSVLFFIFMITAKFWPYIKKNMFTNIIALFGKHSLLVFVIHVYFAKTIDIVKSTFTNSFMAIYLLICFNIIISYLVTTKYESEKSNQHNSPTNILKYLFN